MAARDEKIFRQAPPDPLSRYLVSAASHVRVPNASISQVLEWIQEVSGAASEPSQPKPGSWRQAGWACCGLVRPPGGGVRRRQPNFRPEVGGHPTGGLQRSRPYLNPTITVRP